MFKNILLGVDGSEHALRAAAVAGSLARIMQADLLVVAAYDPVPAYLGEPNLQKVITARMQDADTILKNALQTIGELTGEMQTETLEGPAAEAILAVAKTRLNDLIIVGSRGRGQLTGLLLGSQSQKLIQHAPCPVLVVR
ncbi:MAG: universal stress protein [Chloroflexota bacterium]